jgi:hypothetical protein
VLRPSEVVTTAADLRRSGYSEGAEVWGKTDTWRGRRQHSEAERTRTPRCRCVRVKGRKEVRADNCLGELGRAQVSSPNGDRGRNVNPPAGGLIRSYTFGPFAAEAMLRERKAMKVAKDMDGKGREVRSVEE